MGDSRRICGTIWAATKGVALFSWITDLASCHLTLFTEGHTMKGAHGNEPFVTHEIE